MQSRILLDGWFWSAAAGTYKYITGIVEGRDIQVNHVVVQRQFHLLTFNAIWCPCAIRLINVLRSNKCKNCGHCLSKTHFQNYTSNLSVEIYSK